MTVLKLLGRMRATMPAWLAVAALASPAFAQGALQGMPHKTMPENTTSLGAHARFSKAPINMNTPPNLGLAVALADAGGGATAFDSNAFVHSLSGGDAANSTEIAALTKKFGAANVASFVKTFDFFASDALASVAKGGMALPATSVPPTGDSKALFAAFYSAGVMPNGRYDLEYMLDALFSHIVHVQVMNDIDADSAQGPTADANYHLVFTQLMLDLKKTYGL